MLPKNFPGRKDRRRRRVLKRLRKVAKKELNTMKRNLLLEECKQIEAKLDDRARDIRSKKNRGQK